MLCPSYFISLEIYEESKEALAKSLCEVEESSTAVGMIFGLQKCAVVHATKGKVRKKGAVLLPSGEAIEELDGGNSYGGTADGGKSPGRSGRG